MADQDLERHGPRQGPDSVVANIRLTIQIVHDRNAARLLPIGELDVHSAGTFSIAADLAIDEQPEHLSIDLSHVTFIDSSGMRSVEVLVERSASRGVPCAVVGRRADMAFDPAPIVVWSEMTVRSVDRADSARSRS